MAASVRTEDEAFSDVRFVVLANLCGLADDDHARGKMQRLWRQCTALGTYVLPESFVCAVLGKNAGDSLVESQLGERVDGGFRIKGTRGRVEWLQKLRRNAKKGGQARAAKRQPRGKPDGSQASPKTEPPPSPPVTAPAPSSAPSPTEPEEEEKIARRSARAPSGPHQQAIAEFTAYYQRTHAGASPTWNGKTGAMVSKLVNAHGLHEIVRRLRIAETSPPSFPPTPLDLPSFVQHFDKFAAPTKQGSGRGGPNREGPTTTALRELDRLEREERERQGVA